MSDEIKALQAFVRAFGLDDRSGFTPDQRRALKRAEKLLGERPGFDPEEVTKDAYRAAAVKHWHKDGEIEIDEGAKVSLGGDPGAYVQAWVWVDDGGES
jgi:DNA-binding SARP family transcriptional activator